MDFPHEVVLGGAGTFGKTNVFWLALIGVSYVRSM